MKIRNRIVAAVIAGAFAPGLAVPADAQQASWTSGGRDLANSRYQFDEKRISPKTAPNLRLVWAVDTAGDVTATPAVDGDFVYFPDSAGFLYKVNRLTGALAWKRPISDYTGIAGDSARATPAVAGNALILGNLSGKFLGAAANQPDPQAARVFAVDKTTGDPLWVTQVDETPLSYVTHSAIVVGGKAIVGVASNEELLSAFVPPAYFRFRFRGSVSALDVATGAVLWKTYTIPPTPTDDSNGFAGGAVWGGGGAYDKAFNLVYMATGNNYYVPEPVGRCLALGGSTATCAPGNHINSVIAFDLDTGAIRWASAALPDDAWSVACGLVVPGFVIGPGYPGVYGNCPEQNPQTAGPDYDFAQGPLLWTDENGDRLVGAGQKSGVFWAFNARTGRLVWKRQVAPGGVTGGLQWGSASDGKSIFVAVSNAGPTDAGGGLGALPWTLKNGTVTRSGGWAALKGGDGKLLWTTRDPQGRRAEGAVTGANGVIFGCNLDTLDPDPANHTGSYWALDAKTGATLWSFDPPPLVAGQGSGPCTAGPSVVDGMVYWGSGNFRGQGTRKLYAFGL